MYGPFVNLKFFINVTKDKDEKGFPRQMNTGTDGLHTTHGAFDTGKSIMKASFNILHNSFASRGDCESINVLQTYPVQFCALKVDQR